MTQAANPTEYDLVPYPSGARSSSHLDRLATPALLMDMRPAPINSCRVLELACGDGGNLIPMAVGLPGSQFLGIDLAVSAIDRGNQAVRDLGLTNVTLRHGDLMDPGLALGTFDYVIAHGVYSWVPQPVRERILALIRECLAPHGVAFVSYNAMPGGHLRQMIRDMLRYHTRNIESPSDKLAQARAFLSMLSRTPGEPGDVYRQILGTEAGRATLSHDASLFHDDMADVNDPSYFTDFVDAAAGHGLQFLAEADFFEMSIDFLPQDVRSVLAHVASQDLVMKEQYLDFLKCRRFRQTLLCHGEVALDRSVDLARVKQFSFISPAREAEASPDSGARQFRHPNGSNVTTEDPLAHAAFRALSAAYPRQLTFNALLTEITVTLANPPDPELLAEILFRACTAGVLAFTLHGSDIAYEPAACPRASTWARRQAPSSEAVTNLLHETVRIEGDLARSLLTLLDGTRDIAALTRDLNATIPPAEPHVTEPDVQRMLEALAALALLHKE